MDTATTKGASTMTATAYRVHGTAHGDDFDETFDRQADAIDYASTIIDGDVDATIEVTRVEVPTFDPQAADLDAAMRAPHMGDVRHATDVAAGADFVVAIAYGVGTEYTVRAEYGTVTVDVASGPAARVIGTYVHRHDDPDAFVRMIRAAGTWIVEQSVRELIDETTRELIDE